MVFSRMSVDKRRGVGYLYGTARVLARKREDDMRNTGSYVPPKELLSVAQLKDLVLELDGTADLTGLALEMAEEIRLLRNQRFLTAEELDKRLVENYKRK